MIGHVALVLMICVVGGLLRGFHAIIVVPIAPHLTRHGVVFSDTFSGEDAPASPRLALPSSRSPCREDPLSSAASSAVPDTMGSPGTCGIIAS